jgi:hypothetical protein
VPLAKTKQTAKEAEEAVKEDIKKKLKEEKEKAPFTRQISREKI